MYYYSQASKLSISHILWATFFCKETELAYNIPLVSSYHFKNPTCWFPKTFPYLRCMKRKSNMYGQKYPRGDEGDAPPLRLWQTCPFIVHLGHFLAILGPSSPPPPPPLLTKDLHPCQHECRFKHVWGVYHIIKAVFTSISNDEYFGAKYPFFTAPNLWSLGISVNSGVGPCWTTPTLTLCMISCYCQKPGKLLQDLPLIFSKLIFFVRF